MVNNLKKVVISAFSLYAFNMIAVNFNIVLPINIWTIIYVSFFDISGIAVLFFLKTMGV